VLRYECVVVNQINTQFARIIHHVEEWVSESNICERFILIVLRESSVIPLCVFDLMQSDLAVSEDSSPLVIHDSLLDSPEIVPLAYLTDNLEFPLHAWLSPPVVPDGAIDSCGEMIVAQGEEWGFDIESGLCDDHVVLDTVNHWDLC